MARGPYQEKHQKLPKDLLKAIVQQDLADMKDDLGERQKLAREIRERVEEDLLAGHFLACMLQHLCTREDGRWQWESIAEAINQGPDYFGQVKASDIASFARRISRLPGKPHSKGAWRDTL